MIENGIKVKIVHNLIGNYKTKTFEKDEKN